MPACLVLLLTGLNLTSPTWKYFPAVKNFLFRELKTGILLANFYDIPRENLQSRRC